MKRILEFKDFINEGFLGTNASFIFVPVDKKFKSLDKSLTVSSTPFPSENLGNSVHGYLLVPCTIETVQTIASPYFKRQHDSVKGSIKYTKSPDNDGIIVMNSTDSSGALTGVSSVFAEVPGFSQNAAFYFKSGNALILEMIMRKQGWEGIEVKSIKKKIANGFELNKAISYTFYSGMDDEIESIKKLFSAASDDIGLEFSNPKEKESEEYDSTKELLDLFNQRPGDFMSLNFSAGVFDRISSLAKETGTEEVSKTIDNLGDLKSAGLFDD